MAHIITAESCSKITRNQKAKNIREPVTHDPTEKASSGQRDFQLGKPSVSEGLVRVALVFRIIGS